MLIYITKIISENVVVVRLIKNRINSPIMLMDVDIMNIKYLVKLLLTG